MSQVANRTLDGLRVLLVEDEAIVSFLVEQMLVDLGCTAVWHAGSVADALKTLDRERPDAAVLDVNLGGEKAFPVADHLDDAGVPFIFATGYRQTGMPKKWVSKPLLNKPFNRERLAAALQAALDGR